MPDIAYVRLRRLLDTSTFRLALIYLALFAASAFALLGYLYYATTGFMDRQTAETIQAEISGIAEQYRTQGLLRVKEVIEQRSAAHPYRASIYLLTDPFGHWLAGNIDRWPEVQPDADGWLVFPVSVEQEDQPAQSRRAVARSFTLSGGFSLLVGREVEDRLVLQSRIKQALLAGLALTLVLGLAGGFLLSRGLLRRVDAINRTTRHIMAGDLSRRIPITGSRDEFDQLAANLNAMLDQIERLLCGMREVTDNIAHDLRTPLNRLRSRIEVALMREPEAAETRALLEQSLADAEVMIGTFNALLDIARAEAGSERASFEPLALPALVADLIDLYEPLAEEKGLMLEHHGPSQLTMVANRHLLAQALANLLDNAIKYTPAGGRISLTVEPGPVISVSDNGPGIPEAEREHVLERFVRLEEHRGTPGNGLGLSLVQAVARLHGGQMTLADNQPGLKVSLDFRQVSGRRAA